MGPELTTAVLQKTLKSAISCTGIGLHSGEKVSITLQPADVNTGIVFHRTDVAGEGAEIPATYDNVIDTRMCTTIGAHGKTVSTVEHLMAAFAGAGIDNAVVEVGGAEVPMMDGSAAPFLFLIECAGVATQDAPRKALRILKPVAVDVDDKSAVLEPAEGFSVDFEIEFPTPVIGHQAMSVSMSAGTFKDEIARARTFGFLHEAEALWAAGLAKGASLDNAVVVSGDKIMNDDGLRFDDECVRHKILDAVGDLYMAGAPVIGRYAGVRSSHALNNQLVRAVMSDPANYEVVDMTAADLRLSGAKDRATWSKDTVAASPAMV